MYYSSFLHLHSYIAKLRIQCVLDFNKIFLLILCTYFYVNVILFEIIYTLYKIVKYYI